MPQSPHRARRQLIVNHALQRRMILAQSWPPMLALLLVSAMLCYFCARLADEATAAGATLPSLFPVVATAGGFLIAVGVFVVLHAMRFSHRVAGPMHRIVTVVRSFRDGDDSQRIGLRVGDYLEPLTDDLNDLLQFAAELRARAALPTPTPAPTPTTAVESAVAASAPNFTTGATPQSTAVDK